MPGPIDLTRLTPLFAEQDEATITARWNDWIAQDFPGVDTREGSLAQIITRPPVREFARLYDLAGTELLAAALPSASFGEYLDLHGAIPGILRQQASQAGGSVLLVAGAQAAGKVAPAQTVVATDPADPAVAPLEFATTEPVTLIEGSVRVEVLAVQGGIAGNLAAGSISVLQTPLADGITVVQDEPTEGGSDLEDDPSLLASIEVSYRQRRGSGTETDLILVARTIAGVRTVTIRELEPSGPGTVTVIVGDALNRPLPSPVVAAVQALIDPGPGRAGGVLPPGERAYVLTTALLNVDVSARVRPADGFTVTDGADGVDLRPSLQAAVENLLRLVPSGGQIVYSKVLSAIVDVAGVLDVDELTITVEGFPPSTGANLSIPSTPPKAPVLRTLTLTAAP